MNGYRVEVLTGTSLSENAEQYGWTTVIGVGQLRAILLIGRGNGGGENKGHSLTCSLFPVPELFDTFGPLEFQRLGGNAKKNETEARKTKRI